MNKPAAQATAIQTPLSPAPVGPYSQAVRFDRLIYTSGQIPLDPASGELVAGGIEEQCERVIENLAAVLEAGGSDLSCVIRTTIYLTDLSLFPRVNAVYGKHFADSPAPARSTVGVASLPLGAVIEIDAVASIKD